MATRAPAGSVARNAATTAALSAGRTSACTSSMPSCWATTVGGAAVVAADQRGADAQRMQPRDGRRRAGLGRVAEGQQPQHLRGRIAHQPGQAAALGLQRVGLGLQRPGRCAELVAPARAAQVQQPTLSRGLRCRGRARRAAHRPSRPSWPCAAAACSTARASGCSLPRCSAAASASTSSGDLPLAACSACSRGLPSVSVPVLSKATSLTARICSIACASRTRMPRRAASPVPTMKVAGVARPSAQGQAMTSTDTACSVAAAQSPLREAPAQQRQQRCRQHHRHEDRADAVDQRLDRRLLRLRRFHQPHDARQLRLGADRAHAQPQQAFAVDRAAGDLVARLARHRQAFAGEHRFVEVAGAFDDDGVGGDAFARAHDQHVVRAAVRPAAPSLPGRRAAIVPSAATARAAHPARPACAAWRAPPATCRTSPA